MPLDFSRARKTPFQHQREDTEKFIANPFFFIASQMRTGKTKIVIDGSQFMFESGVVERVIVCAPAPVRDVWYDPTLGQLNDHLWLDLPATITEYHARSRSWKNAAPGGRRLEWIVTNYEFLRSEKRVLELLQYCGPKTLLVGDESSYLKNWKAQQTEAFYELRKACGRIVLLNGTPISHSPLDLFSQGNLLSPSILECKYITHFKARYAIQAPVLGKGGKALLDKWNKPIQTIQGWRDLDDIQRRFATYTVRRLQADCLDLPPKLDPVPLIATLSDKTWKAYKDMRDELVVWLNSTDVATAATAAIKSLRLSQITSGFIGGIEDAALGEEPLDEGLLDSVVLPFEESILTDPIAAEEIANLVQASMDFRPEIPSGLPRSSVVAISREKLDTLLWFLEKRLEEDPNLKVVVWVRYRPELFRMMEVVTETFPQFETAMIVGAQKKLERTRALGLLKPETAPSGPVFVGGTFGTGSFGLDFAAAHTNVNLSYDAAPGKFEQSNDRVYGPGQKFPIAYFDIIAVGPKGQKTIDHHIIAARRAGQDIANWTTSYWVQKLREE